MESPTSQPKTPIGEVIGHMPAWAWVPLIIAGFFTVIFLHYVVLPDPIAQAKARAKAKERAHVREEAKKKAHGKVGLKEKSMKDVVDNELIGVQTECSELKKRVAQLEDGHRLVCEREKRQQEQILYLSNVKDKCEQLETKNRELEVEKDRLEKELHEKIRELNEEKRRECVGLEEKLNDLSSKKDVVERKNGELELEKNRLEKELNDSMAVCNDLRDQNSLLCEREKVALNRITDVCEEIRNLIREKRDQFGTNIADLDPSEKDVSDNDEVNKSRNEREVIQTEINGNKSEEIMNGTSEQNEESTSERSIGSEGDQHEASAELDVEALPTAGIMSDSRNISEGNISEIIRQSEESMSDSIPIDIEEIQREASVRLG